MTSTTLSTRRASPRQPLPRRPSPHCMSSRSRRRPLPGCGRAGGRGRGAGCDRFGGSAREGGGRALYLLTPYGWWLRAQVSRDAPPPLPGGYKLGEKVFYTGASHSFPSGNRLVHGQQGEVTGPAGGEAVKGMGVAVLFPGNKGNVSCRLAQVRRLHAASAATPACPPQTRRCPRPACAPATHSLCCSAPASLHEQPLAPSPNAQRRECGEGVFVRASGF